MRRNNVSPAARLLERLTRLAETEVVSVNRLVTVVIAEKIKRLDAKASTGHVRDVPKPAPAGRPLEPRDRVHRWSRATRSALRDRNRSAPAQLRASRARPAPSPARGNGARTPLLMTASAAKRTGTDRHGFRPADASTVPTVAWTSRTTC